MENGISKRKNKMNNENTPTNEMEPTWVAYKVRQDYPITKTVYWTQKLDGPFTNNVDLNETVQNLMAVQRENKDVKDIRLLVEV